MPSAITGADMAVSTHSRLKAAGITNAVSCKWILVSTHSRLKAAESKLGSPRYQFRFNTQPPEGGWRTRWFAMLSDYCFNTQPPEGGWRLKNA